MYWNILETGNWCLFSFFPSEEFRTGKTQLSHTLCGELCETVSTQNISFCYLLTILIHNQKPKDYWSARDLVYTNSSLLPLRVFFLWPNNVRCAYDIDCHLYLFFNVPLCHTIQQLQRSCLEPMDIRVEKWSLLIQRYFLLKSRL